MTAGHLFSVVLPCNPVKTEEDTCFVVDYVLQTYATLRCINVAVYDLEKERLYFLEVPNLSLNNSFFLVLYLF